MSKDRPNYSPDRLYENSYTPTLIDANMNKDDLLKFYKKLNQLNEEFIQKLLNLRKNNEVSCMYCEKKIKRHEAIILCKECTEK